MLTRAQARALRRLEAGDVIDRCGGPWVRHWFRKDGKTLNRRTVTSLIDKGVIESYLETDHSLEPTFRITTTGRNELSNQ